MGQLGAGWSPHTSIPDEVRGEMQRIAAPIGEEFDESVSAVDALGDLSR